MIRETATRFRRPALGAVLCAALLLPIGGGAQQNPQGAAPAGSQPASVSTAAASPQIPIPAYPNSAKGLEEFMKAMMKAQKNGDIATLQAYAKSLELPDAGEWFKSAFGDDAGPRLAAYSAQARGGIGSGAPDLIAQMISTKRSNVQTLQLDASTGIPFDGCGGETNDEYDVLLLLQRAEPLYDVRFIASGGAGVVWAFFTYANEGFRYVGDLSAADARPIRQVSSAAPATQTVEVEEKVETAKLIHTVHPPYPEAAKAARIQGRVTFHAIIGKDGKVGHLQLVSGPCILAIPAWQAVRQWRYKPTLLGGQPVEVDTMIEMDFTLGQ